MKKLVKIMSQCKTCGKEIVWAKTITGKSIPLDAEPDPGGNIVLMDWGLALVVKPSEHPGRPRYLSHFVTCPDAGKHRKAK
jgi:hypothetical protein